VSPALIRGRALTGHRRAWRLSRTVALPAEVPVTVGFDRRRVIGTAALTRDPDGIIWAEARVGAPASLLRACPWLGLHVTSAVMHPSGRGRPLVTGRIAGVSLMRQPGDRRLAQYEIVS
jgi:hypothetical protein